ncbi:MAG: DUF2177 family protein [Candidatus Roizmanbacteria bacterium]|nr:DUF2177 family protein [Candidatus Roizmanbacteria bacterium]
MFLKLYFTTFLVFFGIDMLWLGLIARKFYAQQLGFLMKDPISWTPAILFYLLFVGGLVIFIIAPAMEKKSIFYALAYGALFGLITYATYDLTNLATLKQWPLLVTVVDLVWGTTLAASVSAITYWIAQTMHL